ncbi:hypothetical protein GCM10011274_05440 [Paraglaciecola chathamensis]|uniref:Uncharacterized protein n=1 Tax=Paraglaciecola chathamensis TaxID=368405 RepID=A0A8H9I9H4_9ALTE|nr:hypothetical protein GCM10011274_05440 [Paraglaciecola oceanifecundans]
MTKPNELNAIMWSTWNDKLELNEVEEFLKKMPDKKGTGYRRLPCANDLKRYNVNPGCETA